MFLFITIPALRPSLFLHLNTSHVLIYHRYINFAKAVNAFKYISCSYLSVFGLLYFRFSIRFKYISCSYLSAAGKRYF